MDNLRLPRGSFMQLEAHAGLDLMKPLASGRARVNVQHILQFLDALDPEDMAVSADEDVGRVSPECGSDAASPASGVPTYVGHPEAQSVELESLMFARSEPYLLPIHIPPYTSDGGQLLELVKDIGCADVAGVENEIDFAQVVGEGRVKPGVRVRENA